MCNCQNNPCICLVAPEINCDPCLSTDICVDKFDASCISYNFNRPDDTSGLSCFLKLPSNTNLKTILEVLDEKLCALESISDINFIDNDCISWTKSVSPSGVITILPILDIDCLITNITNSVEFCQKVADCAVTPPSCTAISSIQKISSTTNSLTLSWGTVTGALSYEIKLFSDFTYTTQVGGTQTVLHPLNTATFTGLTSNTPYYVQTRVNCTNTLSSSVTSAGPFLTDVTADVSCPSITIDSVVVTNNSVTASWTGGVGATTYNVYINGVLQAGMPTALTSFTKNSLTNGNYSIKVEALPCLGTPQSDTELFTVSYNAPAISLNCVGLSQISGSFQQGLSSTGTIRIPVVVTGSDLVNVTVTGTGITGSVINYVVNTFTTYIDVPLTYNGSAPTGARSISVNVVGAVIPSTSCTGSVVVTCPSCDAPSISITSPNSTGFTVGVTPLALGDTFNIVISEVSGPEIINLTGQTTNYVFTGGTALTFYTVSVTKVCACGNSSSATVVSGHTTANLCEEWYNDTSTTFFNVNYTDCNGAVLTAQTVLPGGSICMQPGTGGGGDFGFLIPLGNCTLA